MAYRNLYPRWGIRTYFSFGDASNNLPDEGLFESTLISSTFFLPGAGKNHSIVLRAAAENGWASRLEFPRGYSSGEFSNINLSQRFSAEYSLPLLYPDISAGPLFYVNRIHTSFFYDYMHFPEGITGINSTNVSYNRLSSVGATLGFEMHFLRFYWPLTPTLRYSYRLHDKKSAFSFYIGSSYSFSLGKMDP